MVCIISIAFVVSYQAGRPDTKYSCNVEAGVALNTLHRYGSSVNGRLFLNGILVSATSKGNSTAYTLILLQLLIIHGSDP